MSIDNSKCIILVPYMHFIEPECDEALRSLEQQGYHVWRAGGFSAIDQGRCVMAQTALDKGYEELFWVDSDVGFQTSDVTKIRKHNLPIVAGVYGLKDGSGRPAAEFYEQPTSYNLFAAKAVGAGFLYTKREVYETIQEKLKLERVNGRFSSCYPYFLPFIGDGLFYNTEDFAFCDRARQVGYKIMVDPTIKLKHFGKAAYYWESNIKLAPREVNDTAIVTCYFNYVGYQRLKDNYFAFKEQIQKTGGNLYTIELAFHDRPFELPADKNTVQIRTNDLMWYKENLINMMVARLPEHITKVIWADADIIFYDNQWHLKASKLLDVYPIAQMFSELEDTDAQGKVVEVTECAVKLKDKEVLDGQDLSHYRPGFIWGARREFFKHVGLFDQHILGSNDSWLCYTLLQKKIPHHFQNLNKDLMDRFEVWATKLRNYIFDPSLVGYLDVRTRHMWHGDKKNRQYTLRQKYIADLDPSKHLRYRADGLLEWTEETPEYMTNAVKNYFFQRKEDSSININRNNTVGIVTAVEAKFFPMFQQWYRSVVHVWKDPILVYDIGLTEAQSAWCHTNNIRLERFNFNIPGFTKHELFNRFKDRMWELYIWIKPFMIEEAPFNQVIWLDCDTIVLEPLDYLVHKVKNDGLVVFKDQYNPTFTINGDLSKVLPYGSTTSHNLTLNAGVLAVDKQANQNLMYFWTFAVTEALKKPEVAKEIKCLDQGCLIWAMRVAVKDHLMIDNITWNCPANRLTAAREKQQPRKQYNRDTCLDEIRADHKGINIVHWMGNTKLGHGWEPDFNLAIPLNRKAMFVNHEESRTGAPVILKNVVETFKLHYMNWNAIVVSKRRGGLTPVFDSLFHVKHMEDYITGINNYDTQLEIAHLMLQYERPAFVYANSLETFHYCVAASSMGIPALLHIHELDRDGMFGKLLTEGKLERLNIPNVVYLCACREIADIYIERYKLDPSKVEVITDFCDEDLILDNLKAEQPYRFDYPFIVGCGTADQRKGIDTFLEVATQMPEQRFVWVGRVKGSLAIPDNVFMTGEIDNPHAVINQAEILLLTSREDPFPLVVNEAMFIGKPVVAWRGSGGAEFMIGNYRYLTEQYNVEAFVTQIKKVKGMDVVKVSEEMKQRQAMYLSKQQKLREIRNVLLQRFNISLAT